MIMSNNINNQPSEFTMNLNLNNTQQQPSMNLSNSQSSQLAMNMNNGLVPSFCSLSSSPSFFFGGGGSAPLPSFDKINTVWQSNVPSSTDFKLTRSSQLTGGTSSSVAAMPCNSKANTTWRPSVPTQTHTHKDEGDKLLEEIKLSMEASKRCGTPTTNSVMSRSKKEKRILSASFEPNSYTVICGRSQHCYNSQGNRRFRLTAKMFLPDYVRAEGKTEKSEVVSRVLDVIQKGSPTAAFVAFEKGRFYEVSERVKREKIGGYFRELLPNTYKSSAKAKQAKKAAQVKEQQHKHLELQRLHSTRAPSRNNSITSSNNNNNPMMMPPQQRVGLGLSRQFDSLGMDNLNMNNNNSNTEGNDAFSSSTLADSLITDSLSMTSFSMDPLRRF